MTHLDIKCELKRYGTGVMVPLPAWLCEQMQIEAETTVDLMVERTETAWHLRFSVPSKNGQAGADTEMRATPTTASITGSPSNG